MASAGRGTCGARGPDGGPRRNVPGGAGLAGSAGVSSASAPLVRIESEVYSRAGLLGNPSDAFGGAALAILASNYGAGVVLEAREAGAESLTLVPDPEADATSFASLGALEQRVSDHGYYGGIRLLAAACVAFQRWVATREGMGGGSGEETSPGGGREAEGTGLEGGRAVGAGLGGEQAAGARVGSGDSAGTSLPGLRSLSPPAVLPSPPAHLAVSISYWSSIPRQSGMSGSSAIVLATLDALARLHAWRRGCSSAELVAAHDDGSNDEGAPTDGSSPPDLAAERTDSALRRSPLSTVYSVPVSAGERVLPRLSRPGIALGAEESLGITAGWMDRIVQSFGGGVLLDLRRNGQPMEEGAEKTVKTEPGAEVASALPPASFVAPHPAPPAISVTRVPTTRLPPLYLLRFPSLPPRKDSGSVHADVRRRWKAGEPEVVASMARLAEIARKGARILRGDADPKGADAGATQPTPCSSLAALVDENFAIRLALYGPARLGPVNLRLHALARSVGASATLAGSGGTLVAVCPRGEEQEAQLVQACRAQGASAERIVPAPDLVDVPEGGVDVE